MRREPVPLVHGGSALRLGDRLGGHLSTEAAVEQAVFSPRIAEVACGILLRDRSAPCAEMTTEDDVGLKLLSSGRSGALGVDTARERVEKSGHIRAGDLRFGFLFIWVFRNTGHMSRSGLASDWIRK